MGDDMKKKINELINLLHDRGWTVLNPGQSKHYKVISPDRRFTTSLPVTPGDSRSYRNKIAELRRMGVDIPRANPRKKGR
jgi:hypothetical protein